MNLPRVRFTVRRLMIAVAIVAILFGAVYRLASRRARFLAIAQHHRESITDEDPLLKAYFSVLDGESRSLLTPINRWHHAMTSRYRHAADHPWLPVAPDPPEPE
jgi:hypothetical protein